MSIIFEDIYSPGDTVHVVEDIYDEDTGELRVSKGTEGKVSGMVNPEYVRVSFGPDEFFNVYVLNLVKKWDSDFRVGDMVQATKDIFDQVSYKVLVPRGSHGTVEDINTHDWIKVTWNVYREVIGVHVSEIEKLSVVDRIMEEGYQKNPVPADTAEMIRPQDNFEPEMDPRDLKKG